jgi:hypothetical protein
MTEPKKPARPLVEGVNWEVERTTQLCSELDSTYAHLRAVIENCKHTDVAAIRHQLVGLLPEVQDLEPEVANRMRAKGMGHLADRHADLVRSNWSDFGYPDEPLAKEN